MRVFRYLIPALIAVSVIVVGLSLFQVDTTEYVIVTQFGKPVRAITEPGLYGKWPAPVQSVIRLDRRLQMYNVMETELLTKDKKNILVEAYTTWKIDDPLKFFTSVRDPSGANSRLSDIMSSELGVALSQYDLTNLVTTDPASMQLMTMTERITNQVALRVAPYGFSVTDVRLKMLNFPEANRQSVFQRMRAERQRIARQLRSEGTELATVIRAEAEAERTTILSEAQKQAERIRGEGEAEAIRIYAEAFGQDPEFYQFLRTLEAYDDVITPGTTLILPSDSELLKYLDADGTVVRPGA
jgi:membrane protease subunit HflC